MSRAVFYIQLGAKEEINFGHPLGSLPGWQVYDLDNHADAVTLHYARRLLDEAEEVVIVLKQHSPGNSPGSLAGFLDQALRRQNGLIRAYAIGKTDLPAGYVKKLKLVETTQEGVITLFSSGVSGDRA